MTDYSHLVGPAPEPAPSPKFPTPWHARLGNVYDANKGRVAKIPDCTNAVPNSREERQRLSEFIAEAINEKIARDAQERELAETGWVVEEAVEIKVSPGLQSFIDAVREARERDLALEGYRDDVEYWTHGGGGQGFYRLDPQADHPDPETIDTFYLDEKTLNLGDLLESYVREYKTPCSVLDVPEEFRL